MRHVIRSVFTALILTLGANGVALGQSCDGRCGLEVTDQGSSCFCDANCVSGLRDDCCSDFEEHCPQTAAVGENVCPGLSMDACWASGLPASCAESPEACPEALEQCMDPRTSCPLSDPLVCVRNPGICNLPN